MTYQEVQDKLAKVEYALSALQSGNHAQYTPEAVATKQEQLQTLKESLEEKLKVLKEAEGTVTTDDPKKAKDLADDGANVNLVDKLDEGEEQLFDYHQTKLLAKEVAKAVIGGLKDLGDEVSRARIKDIEPCDFTIYVEYKDGDDDEFVFYCKGDKLHLIDFTFDKEICEVGVKPSGEPILQVDVCKSALKTHWKSMNELHEGLSKDEIEKIKLIQQFRKGERDDLPDPNSDAYKREKIAKMMSKQVSAEEVEYADDDDPPATDAKGENLSIGDVIEYEGKVYQIRYSYSKGRAHLETTDDRGKDNYGEEGYEKIEGEDPRFAEIVKNSVKVNSYAATKGGFMSEGEGDDHHYIKVPRIEYKPAMQILNRNAEPSFVKMDTVDDDGMGNVIIYFMFNEFADDFNVEEREAFMYDAVEDLKANGIDVQDHSAEIDENAKEDHDGKAAPYGSGFKKVNEEQPTVFDNESMDALRDIILKYVEDPDDAEKELDMLDYGGFDAISPEVMANLDRDPEFKAWYNKLHSIEEGTELYDKNGFQFKRFAGPNGVAMQITTNKLKGGGFDYIQIDGSRLGEFISGLSQSIRVFDDMSRQTPVDEGRDLTDIKKDIELVKKAAKEINKLPQDDPKRKAFIEKVKKLNQEKKDYEARMHDKIAKTGHDQELDEAAIKEPIELKDALERYSLGEILDTAEEFYRENGEDDSAQLAKDFAIKFRDMLDAFDGGIEEKKRPDYPDVDGDGDTKEPMEKALKDKKKK